MPFKSEAQRRKFYAMANRGEISKQTVSHWEDATGNKKLPERVGRKKESQFFGHGVAQAMLDLGVVAEPKQAGALQVVGAPFKAMNATHRGGLINKLRKKLGLR